MDDFPLRGHLSKRLCGTGPWPLAGILETVAVADADADADAVAVADADAVAVAVAVA